MLQKLLRRIPSRGQKSFCFETSYQISQHFHDFICDEVLGVIQKNIPIFSVQREAVQDTRRWKKNGKGIL